MKKETEKVSNSKKIIHNSLIKTNKTNSRTLGDKYLKDSNEKAPKQRNLSNRSETLSNNATASKQV